MKEFLEDLATQGLVAASTQNQALNGCDIRTVLARPELAVTSPADR